jgi:hypothetical protein
MANRRLHISGLIAVLLALMAQLGAGAVVPRIDPLADLAAAQAICHGADETGAPADQAPNHSTDCLVCPLCVAVHAPQLALIAAPAEVPVPSVAPVRRAGLLPPATAPPAPARPPQQPRAPPAYA